MQERQALRSFERKTDVLNLETSWRRLFVSKRRQVTKPERHGSQIDSLIDSLAKPVALDLTFVSTSLASTDRRSTDTHTTENRMRSSGRYSNEANKSKGRNKERKKERTKERLDSVARRGWEGRKKVHRDDEM